MNTSKLLELADLLESRSTLSTAIPLKEYMQAKFYHSCGSPGCALGLWAFVKENWKVVNFEPVLDVPLYTSINYRRQQHPSVRSAMQEFDISIEEYVELFSSSGCNRAKNEQEAAAYIRGFVERGRMSQPTAEKTAVISITDCGGPLRGSSLCSRERSSTTQSA